jgi:hypothetical protein
MITKGKEVNLYVRRDDEWVLTACATSSSKDESAEEINITTADSERENEYIGGSKDATIGLEGVITLDEITRWQWKDFVDNVGNVIRILLTYDNGFGDRYSYDANVLVTNVSDVANVADFATFSIGMKRSGAATTTQLFDALQDSDGEYILDSDGNLIR